MDVEVPANPLDPTGFFLDFAPERDPVSEISSSLLSSVGFGLDFEDLDGPEDFDFEFWDMVTFFGLRGGLGVSSFSLSSPSDELSGKTNLGLVTLRSFCL